MHTDIALPAPGTYRGTGNGMVGREGRAADAAFEANRAALAAALNPEPLKASLLADVDTFGDWLSAQCLGTPKQKLPYVGQYAPDMEGLSTPLVVAFLLYPRGDVQAAAADELQARYLRAFAVEG